ncbi:hypothetical protein JTE90_028757 [Oedothorax gibbosus]|uniref:Uncharacterized protein n=1 Tax=Oedothorax gibbosus TaxID=931172 RepID=A0AAV6VVU5_9ARAC|nr:hypothetical protein JTE90_028757 [Oedothorax gibbosus]
MIVVSKENRSSYLLSIASGFEGSPESGALESEGPPTRCRAESFLRWNRELGYGLTRIGTLLLPSSGEWMVPRAPLPTY